MNAHVWKLHAVGLYCELAPFHPHYQTHGPGLLVVFLLGPRTMSDEQLKQRAFDLVGALPYKLRSREVRRIDDIRMFIHECAHSSVDFAASIASNTGMAVVWLGLPLEQIFQSTQPQQHEENPIPPDSRRPGTDTDP